MLRFSGLAGGLGKAARQTREKDYRTKKKTEKVPPAV
jgi:hypothetical protein